MMAPVHKSMWRWLARTFNSDIYFSTRLLVTNCKLWKAPSLGDPLLNNCDYWSSCYSELWIEKEILIGRYLSNDSVFYRGLPAISLTWLICGTVLRSILTIRTIVFSVMPLSMYTCDGTRSPTSKLNIVYSCLSLRRNILIVSKRKSDNSIISGFISIAS